MSDNLMWAKTRSGKTWHLLCIDEATILCGIDFLKHEWVYAERTHIYSNRCKRCEQYGIKGMLMHMDIPKAIQKMKDPDYPEEP